MKAFVLLALVACAPDKIAPPQVPVPIEIAARALPAPTSPMFHGVVASRSVQPVIASADTVITKLRVANGDRVEAGQVLATLDDPALREKLATLPKRHRGARVAIEKKLANMKLVAPTAGVVSAIAITEGTVKRGDELMRISSTKRLQLRFALPDDQRALVAKGTKVTATIAGRATPIDAIVRSVGPTSEAPLHIAIVDAELSTRDIAGLHGALAEIQLAK
jgi:multidrug efflux pump subunit AcrA (membrane-fusion protein)